MTTIEFKPLTTEGFHIKNQYIYSNPSSGIRLKSGIDKKTSIISYDTLGSKVLEETAEEHHEIDLSHVERGKYTLRTAGVYV